MLYFYRPTIDWGRRLELGANTYRVLVHPTPPRERQPRQTRLETGPQALR